MLVKGLRGLRCNHFGEDFMIFVALSWPPFTLH